MRLLALEDDQRLGELLRRALTEAGYATDLERDGRAAITAFELGAYDLVLLDLLVPGIDGGGLEVCRAIRRLNADVPILMLTALDSTASRVEGLDAGADDYLVKPFHLAELLARVRALLRRAPRADLPVLQVQDVVLDPAARRATRAGRPISLTAKEYAVLEFLMRNAGTVVSASTLIDHAWDSNYEGYSNVVQTYIRYLRKKLVVGDESPFIETERGSGYVIRQST
ncbi:MAG: response regulator transcription factor [Rhodoglobus sp.]